MKVGLALACAGELGDPRTMAELAQLAEEAGWDGIFIEDYLVWQGKQSVPTYDIWVTLAAMALSTTQIRLGTSVTPLSRRRPWKLAREAASVDHLSNGRLILGVGLGDANSPDFSGFDEVLDARQRAERLDEALEVLVGLWSGQPFSYQGRHFRVNEVALRPVPVQSPRIPIWVGGGYPLKGPTRRALRWDGSCMYKQPQNESWEDMSPEDVRSLRSLAESQPGRLHPYDIAVGGRRRASDWEKERDHIRSVAEAGATWWIEYLPPDEPQKIRPGIQRGPLRVDSLHSPI